MAVHGFDPSRLPYSLSWLVWLVESGWLIGAEMTGLVSDADVGQKERGCHTLHGGFAEPAVHGTPRKDQELTDDQEPTMKGLIGNQQSEQSLLP
ncbi:hypothetical protein BDV11DRAFT_186762 [Aspergillus similis]